jgi:AraC-like DNA-binding protein
MNLDRANAESDLVKSPKRVTIPDFGVVVDESRHAPGFQGELADVYAKFHLVIAGQARWESSGQRYDIRPNTLFHIAAGVPQRQQDLPNAPVTLYFIHYLPGLLSPWLNRELSHRGMLPLDLDSVQIDRARLVRSLFQQMLFEQAARLPGWETILRARLMELAVETARLSQRQAETAVPVFERGNDSAERVANYALRLKSEFYRPGSLEEAAQSVCLSRRHFTALFRKVTGQTWQKYVTRLRLDYAAHLLAETDKSVTAIAFESGFDDLSHFHHCFKAAYDCAPLTYRDQRNQPASFIEHTKPNAAA